MKKMKAPAQFPGSAKVLWGDRGHSGPGPKPTLSADQIARAAIAVADTHGLAAVSMQRIAGEVHVTTMALYRYFSSKQELIDLMIDTVGGGPLRLDVVSGGWRARLGEWTRRCAAIYHDHPWFLQATSVHHRLMGPNELEWVNAVFAVLADTGLDARQQHEAFLLLIGHVRSNARSTAGKAQGLSVAQWIATTAKLAGRYPDRYSSLIAAIDSGAFSHSPEDGLKFGLECILNGIESLVRKRGKRR